MNQRTIGDNLAYLFPVVILCYTFTLLWGWIPLTHSIITIAVGMAAGLVVSYKYLSQKPVLYLLLYEVVLVLNMLSGDYRYHTWREVFNVTVEILIPVLMTFGIFASNDTKLLNVTVKAILWMLIINAIGSFVVDMTIPGSIRAINGTIRESGDNSIAMVYYRFGLANYVMPHALPCILPVLVMGIKTAGNRLHRVFMAVSLVACLLLIYLSGATTPVLTGAIALIFAFFTNSKTGTRRLVTLGIIATILVAIASSKEIMLPLLKGLDNMMNNEGYFHSKIMDFEDLIVYGDNTGDIEQRSDLYMTSWNAVVENPIIGVNTQVGGHSNLLDCWGYLGLVGLIPFLGFIFTQVKLSAKQLHKGSLLFYYEGVFMAILMLAIKSMSGWESWLFLFTVLPLLTRYVEINRLVKIK